MDRRTFVADVSLYAAMLAGGPFALAAGHDLASPLVGLPVGADPAVLTGTFDVQAFATANGYGTIPAETGPIQEPIADQGAVGDGVADDTAAVQAALAALPDTGGVLDLSQGIFAVSGSADILSVGSKKNITIKGGGWSDGVAQTSGLKVLSYTFTGDPNHAVIRYDPPANDGLNLVVRDLEIDVNNQSVGGITTQADTNTWIISSYIHDVGDGTKFTPRAGIAGEDTQTNIRVIGNVVRRTGGSLTPAPPEGTRGIWSAFIGVTGLVYAHNIVSDTTHSGLILHASAAPVNTVEFNSVIRCGTLIGGACIKAEFDFITFDRLTFDVPGIFAIYRRNYVETPGAWCIQLETTNAELRENLLVDGVRAVASFTSCRKNIVEDNICQEISEYGIHTDVTVPGDDRTGLIYRNNSISADGNPMQYGVNFGSFFTGNIFGFDSPIEVVDNQIVGQSGVAVNTTTDLDNYANFTETNNGPLMPGARNILLPPPYV